MTLVLLILMIAIRRPMPGGFFYGLNYAVVIAAPVRMDLIAPPWPEEVLMSAYVRRWTATTA